MFRETTVGALRQKQITIPSANVLSLFTTPVTLVPAPGAGLALLPHGFFANYVYGGTAYTDHGGNICFYSLTNATYWARWSGAGWWDQTVNKGSIWPTQARLFSTSDFANKPLLLGQDTANPTLGNGSIVVTVTYAIVSAS